MNGYSELSAAKNEPEWDAGFRLKSHEAFKKCLCKHGGADLSDIDFDDLIYYQNHLINLHVADEVLRKRRPLNGLIPEAERAYWPWSSS